MTLRDNDRGSDAIPADVVQVLDDAGYCAVTSRLIAGETWLTCGLPLPCAIHGDPESRPVAGSVGLPIDWTKLDTAGPHGRRATRLMVDHARSLDLAALHARPGVPLGWFSTRPGLRHEMAVGEDFPGGRLDHPGRMAIDVGIRLMPDLLSFGPDTVDETRQGWCRLVHEVHLSEGTMLRTIQPGWPPITGVSDIDAAKGLLVRLTRSLSQPARQEWVARWLAALFAPVAWAPSRRDATTVALVGVMLRRWSYGTLPDHDTVTAIRPDLAVLVEVA
jgi:hypothetical protein